MRILIISDSLAIGGGAEKFAASLGNELNEKNHEIYNLTSFDEKPRHNLKGNYFTFNESRHKNILYKIKDFFLFSYKIKEICLQNEIDLIVSVGEVANFRAILSKKLFRNKVHVYASQHLHPETNCFKFDRIRLLYPHADKVICVSRTIEMALKEKYRLNNLLTIYNMIDIQSSLEKANEPILEKYKKLVDGKPLFINIGRLSFQKGQWFLIRSFKEVTRKHKDAILFILGEGHLKSELKELINDLNLENNVFLIGTQENVYPFLKNSKCFILTSLFEGFPFTLIETLLMGVPVISTDCKTGPRECLCPSLNLDQKIIYPYYGEYGILIEPFEQKLKFSKDKVDNKEKIISDLIIKFIEDPGLIKKYKNGFHRAKNFDKDLILNKWEQLFNK